MFVHWNTTMIITGVLLWNTVTLLRSSREKNLRGNANEIKQFRRKVLINLLINIANFATGVIVAAIDGSRRFNTFPDMDGKLIPEGYLQEKPILRDFFENIATAQFHHRLFRIWYLCWSSLHFLTLEKIESSQFRQKCVISLIYHC